jgi:hypothetical protein
MAVSTENIQMSDLVAKVSAIALESGNITQAWYGANQIWAPGGGTVTETWLTHPEQFLAVEYTPSEAKTVISISMTFNSNQAFNYTWGIWTKSGSSAIPLTGFVGVSNTTGVSFVNAGTLDTFTKFTHTKTWASGARPILAGGTTYLIGLGERYQSSRKIIGSSTSNTWQFYEWSTSATANPSVSSTASSLKPILTVVTE